LLIQRGARGRGGGIGTKKPKIPPIREVARLTQNAGKVGLQGKGVFQERKIGQGNLPSAFLKSPGKTASEKADDQKKSDERKKGSKPIQVFSLPDLFHVCVCFVRQSSILLARNI
jgi:hypothetical protein